MQDRRGVMGKEGDAMLESLQLHQCDQQLQLTDGRRGPPISINGHD